MRDDMHEVIIERPRWGSRMRHARRFGRVDPKRTTLRDPDSLPFHKSMGRAAEENPRPKEFRDLLSPLERYLASQVDRPWDKVWSEICENFKVENPAQRHLRLHVQDFVAVNTYVRDGAVWLTSRWGANRPLTAGCTELYVDPRIGILRRNKHHWRYSRSRKERAAAAARERAQRMREISADVQLHLLRDCWWEITLAPIRTEHRTFAGRTGMYYMPYHDALIGSSLTKLAPRELYGRDGVYALSKRQLKSAEIVRLGLRA
jgi:hypothetical protein